MIWSKKMSGNFCCCKCDLKEPRDSQIPKFPSQPNHGELASMRGEEGTERREGKEGDGKGRGEGKRKGEGKGKEGKEGF